MSVDVLQEKIRKLKNPTILELMPMALPGMYSGVQGYGDYCVALLEAMKGLIPGVRIRFSAFALLGEDGILQLKRVLKAAAGLHYYVILDAPEQLSTNMADVTAKMLLGPDSAFLCDGVVVGSYAGSDVWKAYLPYCREGKKDLYCVVRTGNKSASELQDLLAGSRMVHLVAADHANRYGEDMVGKFGFSRVAVMAAASSAESLRQLRTKYPRLFLLVDGLDYPSANAKNCSGAFDRYGYGAAVCCGPGITEAWTQEQGDPIAQAVAAAERVKRNLGRYVTIL